MATATRRDVELAKTGTWAASTGVTTITDADLASIVEAYQDPEVDRPVIKLGHASPLNDGVFGDAEPAFGWVENVGVGDGSAARPDPHALYGDYVGMPAKLAEVSDTAYRRRSVEIAWETKTPSGKRYRAVLAAVSLLGVQKPAIKGLSDVLALYADADQQGGSGGRSVVVQGDGVPQLDVAALARFAAASETSTDTGSVPHTTVAATEGDTTTSQSQQEGTRMSIKKADVDQALAQAGDEDVTERLRLLLGDGEATASTDTADDTANPAAESGAQGTSPAVTVQTPQGVTVTAASEDSDTVVITKAMFTELQAGAQAGAAAATQIAKERRDQLVVSAFRAGKITATEQDTWRAKLDENEELTTSLLSALTPRFAVTEHGNEVAGDATTSFSEAEAAEWDEFNKHLTAFGA